MRLHNILNDCTLVLQLSHFSKSFPFSWSLHFRSDLKIGGLSHYTRCWFSFFSLDSYFIIRILLLCGTTNINCFISVSPRIVYFTASSSIFCSVSLSVTCAIFFSLHQCLQRMLVPEKSAPLLRGISFTSCTCLSCPWSLAIRNINTRGWPCSQALLDCSCCLSR